MEFMNTKGVSWRLGAVVIFLVYAPLNFRTNETVLFMVYAVQKNGYQTKTLPTLTVVM